MQQRGVSTRAALLQGAIAVLVDEGYAATTTTEVADRAGVSRGAQLHHFPTKAKLLAAAVEQLLERRNEEFREAFSGLEPGRISMDAAIDLLWTMYRGPTYVAWAELWLAARTDPELAVKLVQIGDRFDRQSLDTLRELMPPAPGADPDFQRLALAFTYSLMNGMALEGLVPHERLAPPEELVGALKVIAGLFNPTTTTAEEEGP